MGIDPVELQDCLDSMVFVVDTREQPTKRFDERVRWLEPHVRERVNAGDYTAKTLLPDGTWFYVPCAVERKMSFTELCGCYCQERGRFTAEFERAKANGVKIVMLIENATWEDAYAGNYRSKMNPKSFVASILTWLARYNCQILFCRPQTTGKLIRDILRYEMREALEKLIDY